MGFEIQRFIKEVNNHLLCCICKGVLEEPIMSKACQHFYCMKCIQNSKICPMDNNSITTSQFVEPQQLVLNLLNELQLKCEFEGCDETIFLGEISLHRRICDKNPKNTSLIKCFCGKEMNRKELSQHKNDCLSSIKNEIHINRLQIATFMADITTLCNSRISGKRGFRSETEYLYHKLTQTLPQKSRDQNAIQNILLFLSWRLLEYRPSSEEHNKINSALRDLYRATNDNSEAIRLFHRTNGLDYILLTREVVRNHVIDFEITEFLVNISKTEEQLKKLMDKPILELLISLSKINSKINGIQNSFNCITVLSLMIISIKINVWKELSTNKVRKDVLRRIKMSINGWKLNVTLKMYSTLDKEIAKLRSHLKEMPKEVLYRFVWILVHHTRANPKKYVPMIDKQNIIQLLQPIVDDSKTEDYIKDFIQLLFYQINTFKSLGHLNGLENTDKKEFLIS